MTEHLTRLCDCTACTACTAELPDHPVGSDHAPGAFCSKLCAGHAGGELGRAREEHREADAEGEAK